MNATKQKKWVIIEGIIFASISIWSMIIGYALRKTSPFYSVLYFSGGVLFMILVAIWYAYIYRPIKHKI